MARKCFYSFHFKPDNWRVAQVRNIGAIEGNRPANDNRWEAIKKLGDGAIKRWIAGQMFGRSCAVVLVGSNTAQRKWIDYEIVEAWKRRMGVVGIHVYGLRDRYGYISHKGKNPFEHLHFRGSGVSLASIVKCYDPVGANSRERYAWIRRNLAAAVEEAIRIRLRY